jgi:ABC-type transport system substrate-binding protein
MKMKRGKRFIRRTSLLLLAAILIAALAFAGCTKSDDSGGGEAVNDSLVYVSIMSALSLSPLSGAITDPYVTSELYDTLVRFNPDYTIAPRLAESWTESEDGMAVDFKIRSGAKFSDGSTVTAEDAVWSLNKYMETPYGAALGMYATKIELVGDDTVRITKATRGLDLLRVMAVNGCILPQKLVEADPEGFEKNPVGSGPYIFVEQQTDGSVVMKANEDYYLGAPEIKTVTVKPPMDMATAVVALKTGEVDLVPNIPTSQYSMVEGDENLVLQKETSLFNRCVAPVGQIFVDYPKLREAVYHAVNAENALLIAGEGDGVLSEYLIPELNVTEYREELAVESDRYNPELAKQLLAESGYDTSVPIKVPVDASMISLAQVVQSDLKEIGLTMEIEQVDYNTYLSLYMSADIPIIINDMGGPYLSIFELVKTFSTPFDTMNLFRVKSPELDAAIIKVVEDADPADRDANMIEMIDAFKAMKAYVPLYQTNSNAAYTNRLAEIPFVNLSGAGYFEDITLRK